MSIPQHEVASEPEKEEEEGTKLLDFYYWCTCSCKEDCAPVCGTHEPLGSPIHIDLVDNRRLCGEQPF